MQTMRKLRADSAKLFLGWTDNSTELWQNISRKISLTTESIGTTILCTLFGYKHIKVLPKIYNSQTLLACNHTLLYLAFYSKLCSKVLWGWIIFYLRDFKSSYYHSRPRLLPKFWCNYLTDVGVCCTQKRFAVMIPGVQDPKYAGHVHRDARRRNKTLPRSSWCSSSQQNFAKRFQRKRKKKMVFNRFENSVSVRSKNKLFIETNNERATYSFQEYLLTNHHKCVFSE